MMLRIIAHVTVSAGLLALAGCALMNEAETTPTVACLDASSVAGNMFRKGAIGAGKELMAARAIKSHDFENLYFVAMYFSVEGKEDQVGVWVTDSLEPAGGLIPVDATAKEYSAREEASGGAINISATDASIAGALSCLN